MEVRLRDNPAVTAAMTPLCASGHVVAFLGQSEMARAIGGGSSSALYGGTLPADQVQMVKGDATFRGGAPGSDVTSFRAARFFVDNNPDGASVMTQCH